MARNVFNPVVSVMLDGTGWEYNRAMGFWWMLLGVVSVTKSIRVNHTLNIVSRVSSFFSINWYRNIFMRWSPFTYAIFMASLGVQMIFQVRGQVKLDGFCSKKVKKFLTVEWICTHLIGFSYANLPRNIHHKTRPPSIRTHKRRKIH